MKRSQKHKLLSSFLTFSILFSSNCFAGSIVLNKGEPAPFDGILVDKTTAEEIRVTKLELEEKKKLLALTENKLSLKDLSLNMREEQVSLLRSQNDALYSRLDKTTNTSTWEKLGWFALGVIGTGLAVRAASGIAK